MVNQKMSALGNKRSVIREIFEYGKIRSAEIGADKVFDFSLGNPSVSPPEEVKTAIAELNRTTEAIKLHGYTSAQGDFEARKAVADSINDRFGVGISAEAIYMTCGAAASLTVSLKALCNDGDEVILFAPYFTEYKVFVENAGATAVIVSPTADFMIDAQDLESKITKRTKAVIINSPNNPSGVVYTEEVVREVVGVLNKKQAELSQEIYLIADEPYRELCYDGVEAPYLMNYYDNTLVCYSYSKALSIPGERIGYIAVNPKMKDEREVYSAVCGAGRSLGYVCAPSTFQQVIKRCINVKVNLQAYKRNRDLLYGSLTALGFECVKPDGAFYLFVKSPLGSAEEFYLKAREKEILIVPCADFGAPDYVRIAYCVDESKIVASLPAFRSLAEQIFGKTAK